MTTVTLAAEQEALVRQLIDDGDFVSPDDAVNFVLAQALGSAPEYSEHERAHIQEGIDQADRGEVLTQEETEAFFKDWRRNG